MARRRLTPEEIALWHKVVENADPMDRAHQPPKPMPKPTPVKPPKPRVGPFDIGQTARSRPVVHDLKPSVSAMIAGAPVQMDRKSFGRMKRGKLKPEGRIDLHGMTAGRAHPALTAFILSSQAAGKRLVLVITGKGRAGADTGPIPTPRGVLKHQVPHWLSIPPLAQAVLQVSEAHQSHGGSGAYYVYLRRAGR